MSAKGFLLLITTVFSVAQAYGQTYVETFDSGPDAVTSFNRTIGGVEFQFVFTADGDGGDFAHVPDFGSGNSASLDLRSANFDVSTTERVTISRSDGELFEFTSLFVRNDNGTTVTIQGYDSGASVGTSQTVSVGQANNYSFGVLVDEVELTATDYFNVNLDDFAWTVPPPNSPPVATAPSAPVVNEDASNVALADDIQVADVDGDDQTVSLAVTGGTVNLGTAGITFDGSGNGSANFTAAGTLADINAALDAATFTPAPNLYGNDAASISFVANDGSANSNTAVVTFDITGVNDAPEVVLPASIEVTDEVASPLSGISFADIDAGPGNVSAALSVPRGTLAASSGGGVTVTGSGSGSLLLSGALADVNAFIAGANVTFLNQPGDTSDHILTVSVNDNGNTGTGGSLGDSGTVTLTVTVAPQYSVTASVNGGGGAISPDEQIVDEGEDAILGVTPDTGWDIDTLVGDTCTPVDQGDGIWLAADIAADCSVTADFIRNAVLELTASARIYEGETLVLTATVNSAAAPGDAVPGGTVSFRMEGEALCDAPALVDGVAECEVSNLPIGEHLIEASYSGDAEFDATSAMVTVTVVVEGEQAEAVAVPTTGRLGLLLLVMLLFFAGLLSVRAGARR